MLLGDDVVTDGQPEARTLAGWLGGKERLEQLVPVLGRDADTVVAYSDLDPVTEIAG